MPNALIDRTVLGWVTTAYMSSVQTGLHGGGAKAFSHVRLQKHFFFSFCIQCSGFRGLLDPDSESGPRSKVKKKLNNRNIILLFSDSQHSIFQLTSFDEKDLQLSSNFIVLRNSLDPDPD